MTRTKSIRMLLCASVTLVVAGVAIPALAPRVSEARWLEHERIEDAEGRKLRLFEDRYTDAFRARGVGPERTGDYVDLFRERY